MLSEKPLPYSRASLFVGLAMLCVGAALPSFAKDYNDEETAALLKVLPGTKVSLSDGVRQAAKGGEAVTSAKLSSMTTRSFPCPYTQRRRGLASILNTMS